MTYRRSNPSPRFRELLDQYRAMHRDGDVRRGTPAEQTFDGKSLPRQAQRIKGLIERTSAKALLDYGSGKGRQYLPAKTVDNGVILANSMQEYWGVESVRCYDPGQRCRTARTPTAPSARWRSGKSSSTDRPPRAATRFGRCGPTPHSTTRGASSGSAISSRSPRRRLPRSRTASRSGAWFNRRGDRRRRFATRRQGASGFCRFRISAISAPHKPRNLP